MSAGSNVPVEAAQIGERDNEQREDHTVFGSSRPKETDADYRGSARLWEQTLAKRGFAVCSGGYGGVMEAVSRGAKEPGGKTYGVTAEFFKRKANEWIDVEVRKKTWEERLFSLDRIGRRICGVQGRDGNVGGIGGGLGDAEQVGDAGEAVRGVR